MTTLEQETKTSELVVAPSEEEKAKTTSKEKEPTLERTYTEEEFRKAQSSWDRQITLYKAEADKVSQITEHLEQARQELRAKQEELDQVIAEKLEEDPASLKRFKDSKTFSTWEKELKSRQEKIDKEAMALAMERKANEVMKEFGIPLKELENAKTPLEIEVLGLRYMQVHPKEETKEVKEPKFDNAISSGGQDWRSLPPAEKVKRELAKLKK